MAVRPPWCSTSAAAAASPSSLRRHGVNAIGGDTGTPAPIVPEIARILLGQDALILPTDLRRQVQAMLILDVLEHLPAPAAFVASLVTAFDACRDIVITVPARQELWSNYDEYYGHYRRYDLKSAETLYPRNMLERTGVRYAFRLLYPPALALSITKAGRSVSIAAPSPAGRPVHGLLARYFQMESALVPRWIRGTSVVMTLRRRATPLSS